MGFEVLEWCEGEDGEIVSFAKVSDGVGACGEGK